MSATPRRDAPPKVPLTRHWVVLFASALLEAVWALALKESQGFTVLAPTITFAIANPLSMVGLGYAMRGLPISVAYAVWTGLGAALTVGASILLGMETPSVLKLVFLGGIVACVVGLKFTKDPDATPGSGPAAAETA